MTTQKRNEVEDMLFILDDSRFPNECTKEELRREIFHSIEKYEKKFKRILGKEQYEIYVEKVKELVLDSKVSLEKRKAVYIAALDGQLIGAFL